LPEEYQIEVTQRSALFADALASEIWDGLRETLRSQTVAALRSGSENPR
jgi:hypothetical protein